MSGYQDSEKLRRFGEASGSSSSAGNWRDVESGHMNEAPRGTARRSAEGALLVRELHDNKLGWKLVPPESEHCVFFGDQEIDPLWLEWPIIWCPNATFHEQDNIRRAQGRSA
jgi:hypothetical protein